MKSRRDAIDRWWGPALAAMPSWDDAHALWTSIDSAHADYPRTARDWSRLLCHLPQSKTIPSVETVAWAHAHAPDLLWGALPPPKGSVALSWLLHHQHPASTRSAWHSLASWVVENAPAHPSPVPHETAMWQALLTASEWELADRWKTHRHLDPNTTSWPAHMAALPGWWDWFLRAGGNPMQLVEKPFPVARWVSWCHADKPGPASCEAWGRTHDPQGATLLDAWRLEREVIQPHRSNPATVLRQVMTTDIHRMHPESQWPVAWHALAHQAQAIEQWLVTDTRSFPADFWTSQTPDGKNLWFALLASSTQRRLGSPLFHQLLAKVPLVPDAGGRGWFMAQPPDSLFSSLSRLELPRSVRDAWKAQSKRHPDAFWGGTKEHQDTWAQQLLDTMQSPKSPLIRVPAFFVETALSHPEPSRLTPALRGSLVMLTLLHLQGIATDTQQHFLRRMQAWSEAGPLHIAGGLGSWDEKMKTSPHWAHWRRILEAGEISHALPSPLAPSPRPHRL